MRQWLAVAICFYATRYFFNDNKPKIIPYILLNAIGISIHYSAIAILILLIPVLLSKTKNRKLQVLRSLSVLAIIAGIFLGLYFFKERSYDKLLNPSKFEFGFMVIFKSLVIILIAFNFKLEKSDRNGELFLSKGLINYQYGWVILTECLYVALSSLSYGFEVLGRIAWYFELFETLFFANILSRRTNSLAVWASRFLIIVIIVTKFTGNFSVEEMRSPYLFFWQ